MGRRKKIVEQEVKEIIPEVVNDEKLISKNLKMQSFRVVIEGIKVKEGDKQLLPIGKKYVVGKKLAEELVKLNRAKIVS